MDVPGIVNRWSSSSARNLTNKSRFDCFGSGPCTRHGATTTHLSSALDSGIYPIEIEFLSGPFFGAILHLLLELFSRIEFFSADCAFIRLAFFPFHPIHLLSL
jgi:hypothetical protein